MFDHAALEDPEQRNVHFPLLLALLAPVPDPDLGLLDVIADQTIDSAGNTPIHNSPRQPM